MGWKLYCCPSLKLWESLLTRAGGASVNCCIQTGGTHTAGTWLKLGLHLSFGGTQADSPLPLWSKQKPCFSTGGAQADSKLPYYSAEAVIMLLSLAPCLQASALLVPCIAGAVSHNLNSMGSHWMLLSLSLTTIHGQLLPKLCGRESKDSLSQECSLFSTPPPPVFEFQTIGSLSRW
jgi:hypothetical protein